MDDLKATQMNIRSNLIWEFMIYKYEPGYYTMEVSKNIYCTKGEGAVDNSILTRWFEKFH